MARGFWDEAPKIAPDLRLVESRVKVGIYQKIKLDYTVEWNTLPKPYPFDEVYRVPVVNIPMMKSKKKMEKKNAAMATKGGIDFTANKTPLKVQSAGDGIKFHLDPAMLVQLQNASGFVPVIISIQPVIDLKSFLDSR